ncbi:MAG: hypothetical protein CVU41_09510 [Chloroflexi bacterium HGW-Chloroflexi-3]|nr:MAG: hypothetical protein CVU41_09510 [Chloroflexi bacterium HGW-Chloroflexi-3]
MIQLLPDFKEFLKLLNKHKVEYLLVGGYAVGYHGYPRATADMDIWIDISPINAKKIVSVLNEFGFESPELTEELFLEENKVIRMGVPPVRLELITSISGVEFNACFQQKNIGKIDGIEVNIIDLENLRKNKKASGRYKDLNDLENLPES